MAGWLAIPLGEFMAVLVFIAFAIFLWQAIKSLMWWLGAVTPIVGGWIQEQADNLGRVVAQAMNDIVGWATGWAADSFNVIAARITAVSQQAALAALEFGWALQGKFTQVRHEAYNWALNFYWQAVGYANWLVSTWVSNLINLINAVQAYLDARIRYITDALIPYILSLVNWLIAKEAADVAYLNSYITWVRQYVDANVGRLDRDIAATRAYAEALSAWRRDEAISWARTYTDQQVGTATRTILDVHNRDITQVRADLAALARSLAALAAHVLDLEVRCINPTCNALLKYSNLLNEAGPAFELGLLLELIAAVLTDPRGTEAALVDTFLAPAQDVGNQLVSLSGR